MAQYVLKYRGLGASPKLAKAKLSNWEKLVMVHETENELIVSGPSRDAKSFSRELDGWVFAPVRRIPRPPIGANRHPRVRSLK